jgi:hypothetical protein
VAEHRWDNVDIVIGEAATAPLPADVDGALLCLVHDLVRSRAVVDRIVCACRPRHGLWPQVGAPLGVAPQHVRRRVIRPYVTTFEGLDAPWDHPSAGSTVSRSGCEHWERSTSPKGPSRANADLLDLAPDVLYRGSGGQRPPAAGKLARCVCSGNDRLPRVIRIGLEVSRVLPAALFVGMARDRDGH